MRFSINNNSLLGHFVCIYCGYVGDYIVYDVIKFGKNELIISLDLYLKMVNENGFFYNKKIKVFPLQPVI